MSAELAADIADMELALQNAKRPNVRAMLSEYLQQLKAERDVGKGINQGAASPTAAQPSPEADRKPTAKAASAPTPAPAPPDLSAGVKVPAKASVSPPPSNPGDEFKTISSFGWDQDEYSADPNFVSVYITSGVDGVGDIKDRVTCDFTKSSFDLKIIGLGSPPRNYRLVKTNLEKEIVPEKSKVIVKKNQIKIKLSKLKQNEFGHAHWSELTAKRPPADKGGDPGADLMDMMKDLYDNGDDTMKKTLGEAMLKSRQNQALGMGADE